MLVEPCVLLADTAGGGYRSVLDQICQGIFSGTFYAYNIFLIRVREWHLWSISWWTNKPLSRVAPLLSLTDALQRNIEERDLFFYHVPPVNALTVVWPLIFNASLLVTLIWACKFTAFWLPTALVVGFVSISCDIYNKSPSPHTAHLLLRKRNGGWKKSKTHTVFLRDL